MLFEEVSFNRFDILNPSHTLKQDDLLTSDIIIFLKKEPADKIDMYTENRISQKISCIQNAIKNVKAYNDSQKFLSIQSRLAYYLTTQKLEVEHLALFQRELTLMPEKKMLKDKIIQLEKDKIILQQRVVKLEKENEELLNQLKEFKNKNTD